MDAKHEEMKDLVAAYVLGAVSPSEVSFVRSHIMSCGECMVEADSYSEVVSGLALAVDDVPLPKGFPDAVVAEAVGPKVATAKSRRWRFSFAPVLSAAAVLLAFVIMTAQVVQTRQEIQQQGRVVSALLHNEGGLNLKGGGAVAKMVPTQEGVLFVASGLQEAPNNFTYQLWLLDDGKPESVDIFDVEDGVALVEAGIDLDAYDSAAVTLEPAGGSATPSDTVVLSASA
ncbi:MAG: anti-sigma factor [Actinomycetota bacterium]